MSFEDIQEANRLSVSRKDLHTPACEKHELNKRTKNK